MKMKLLLTTATILISSSLFASDFPQAHHQLNPYAPGVDFEENYRGHRNPYYPAFPKREKKSQVEYFQELNGNFEDY